MVSSRRFSGWQRFVRSGMGRSLWGGSALIAALWAVQAAGAAASAEESIPRLRVAALEFGVLAEANAQTSSRVGARATEVVGPLNTTVLLLEEGQKRLCLVTTHFGRTSPANVNQLLRESLSEELQIPVSHVWIFNSHNHSSVSLASNGVQIYNVPTDGSPPPQLLPIGEKFLSELLQHTRRLPGRLEPASVWWAEGHEDRITYNRKGRRADGSTFFMREEDRVRIADDFRGDIDTQAPLIVFKNESGEVISALTQFTGHPVTSYHPEKPVVFGDWPQVACEVLAEHLGNGRGVPVGFLQGCAGDVNSKEMFVGGVERATEYGKMLGESYIRALEDLQPSRRDGLDVAVETVNVPLAPLPSREQVIAELKEMDDFIRRARDGDEETLSCVGLNFPRALTPKYRAELVELTRHWNVWALKMHEEGKADSVPEHLEMEIVVFRLGDVAFMGLPCEPFQGIGRIFRENSPLPLNVPCGYGNVSYGYITDGPNTGDGEYMSSFYRYTKYRPPLKPPAGDVLAERAVELVRSFSRESTDR